MKTGGLEIRSIFFSTGLVRGFEMWMESWCSFDTLNSIFLEIPVEVGTGLMFALFTIQRKGSKIFSVDSAGGLLPSFASSKLDPASFTRKKMSDAEAALNGAITLVMKGGSGIVFTK